MLGGSGGPPMLGGSEGEPMLGGSGGPPMLGGSGSPPGSGKGGKGGDLSGLLGGLGIQLSRIYNFILYHIQEKVEEKVAKEKEEKEVNQVVY